MICRSIALAVFLLSALAAVAPAQAAEEILDYKSHIKVERNGDLLITETIRVRAEGRQIKRGIFRWFPTRYDAPWGGKVKIPFDVIRVLRDGKPEPWFTRSQGDGISVYAGRKDVLLRPGIYTYTIVFRTARQIGFFKDFDELYFNAIGHKWLFTIRKATVTVELPKGAGLLGWTAYTGRVGERNKSYDAGRDAKGNLTFTTTYPLYRRNGMTVSVKFQKGFVEPPRGPAKVLLFLWDNQASAILALGLIVVGLYFLITWWRIGRDPRRGTIIPLFGPPKGLSPAACRFVLEMGYDRKAFAAAIVDMAVKGYLKIKQSGKTFTLEKTGATKAGLSTGEKAIAAKIFGKAKSVELKNKNASKVSSAIKGLKSALSEEWEAGFFARNRWQFAGGAVLSLIFAAVAGFSLDEGAGVSLLMLSVFGGVATFFVWRAVLMWRGGNRAAPVMFLVLSILMGGFFAILALLIFEEMPWVPLVGFALLGAMNILFFELLNAPTREGRALMDEIEGFRMYLGVGEKERLDLVNPPEETPELFEKFLPYAMALDVETRWSKRFEGVLARAGRMPDEGGTYIPTWYFATRGSDMSLDSLTGTLSGSFANAAASASVAPGSSSGGGSGGFSGGGGGGGGGGGW